MEIPCWNSCWLPKSAANNDIRHVEENGKELTSSRDQELRGHLVQSGYSGALHPSMSKNGSSRKIYIYISESREVNLDLARNKSGKVENPN